MIALQNRWGRMLLLVFVFSLTVGFAGAQPKWAKKATKAVFTLKTFGDDGALIGSSTGFFINEQGVGVSSFAPFRGASRAVVVDASDTELPVVCILGANDTYDVAKFRVDAKKSQALPLSAAPVAEGSQAWLLPFHEQKKIPQGTVRKAETFQEQYTYYTLAMKMPEGSVGAPLLNEAGEVVALMQQPTTVTDTLNYAVSALFADSLKITGLSINDAAMRSTKVKKALPDDLAQAQLSLFVGSQSLDSVAYASLVDDFIAQFPNASDGYITRAQMATDAQRFADADSDMQQGLKMSDKKDEIHYSYSQLIYHKLLYMSAPYEPWTLERALEEARLAYKTNPMPTYQHQEAYVLYSMKQYQEAAQVYEQLSQTNLRSAELFFEASRCQLQMGDTVRQLALLDSAVALYSRPYLREAAPYLMARAQARLDAGKYRDAVNDYNDYEELMKTQVNATFYYRRFQAEVGGRLFQQALNDIEQAIRMQPDSDLYLAEKASLQLRVGLYDDVIETGAQLIGLNAENSDGYLFTGVAQCLKGMKKEGVKNLQKAKELGDQQADALIEKYSK